MAQLSGNPSACSIALAARDMRQPRRYFESLRVNCCHLGRRGLVLCVQVDIAEPPASRNCTLYLYTSLAEGQSSSYYFA